MLDTVNLWAVLAGALINMIVGTLWYGPVFGKMWKGLMGFTDEAMKNMPLTAMQAMAGGLLTSIVMSYVLAQFLQMANVVDVSAGLQLVFFIWLGFIATVTAGTFLWEGKPFKLYVLLASEYLVALCLMTVVLVMWR